VVVGGAPLDVEDEVVVVVAVDVVVVTGGAVVVVVAPEPGVITNPQPRAGSFNVKGSEIGNCVDVGGAVVVVVVVVDVVRPVGVVVVVVSTVDVEGVVVVDVEGVFFVTSRPTPVNARPSSTTRRTSRNGHRRAEGVFRDTGTLRHGNSQRP
jgi:hypothetical protein